MMIDPISLLFIGTIAIPSISGAINITKTGKRIFDDKTGRTKQREVERNKKMAGAISNSIEPFLKQVKYDNKLIQESLSTHFEEIHTFLDDIDSNINKGFENISNELGNLNLKLDFISNSIISISNNLDLISKDINILLNVDYQAGLKFTSNFLLTNNQRE